MFVERSEACTSDNSEENIKMVTVPWNNKIGYKKEQENRRYYFTTLFVPECVKQQNVENSIYKLKKKYKDYRIKYTIYIVGIYKLMWEWDFLVKIYWQIEQERLKWFHHMKRVPQQTK